MGVVDIQLRNGESTEGNAGAQEEEGGDDESIELEVVFGSDTVVEPLTMMVEKLDTPPATFAMKAVGRVELYTPAAFLVFVFHDFIHITRAETGAGMLVPGKTDIHTQIHVMDNQVGRLIFPVDGF